MLDILDPLESFNHLLKHWWKLVMFAILGGLVGLAISFIQPSTYQSEATFHASIDFTEINYENMVGEYGDPLIWTQYEEDLALQAVERVLLNRLDNAYEYAKTLDPSLAKQTFKDNQQIQRYLAKWFLRYRHENPATAQAIVNYWAEDGLQAFYAAQEAGRVESFVIVDLTSTADLPQTPIYHHRNTLVLAGTAAGFLFGILLVDFKERFLGLRKKEG